MVLALNLGVSLMSVALTPAEGSMIPRVVPKAQLETAMSVFNLTLQASFAIGFAFLGPLMVTIAGPSFVLGVVTAFYVAASIACIGLPSAPPIAPRRALRAAHRSTTPSVSSATGLAVVRREPDDQPSDHPARDRDLGRERARRPRAVARGRPSASSHRTWRSWWSRSGIGVVLGVFGLRRFGERWPRRRVAEGGLLVLGTVTAALAGAGWLDESMHGIGVGVGALPVVIVTAMIAGAAYAVTSVTAQTNLTDRRRPMSVGACSVCSRRSSRPLRSSRRW